MSSIFGTGEEAGQGPAPAAADETAEEPKEEQEEEEEESKQEEEEEDDDGTPDPHARAKNTNENGVDAVTKKMEAALENANYFKRDLTQKLPIVTWAWSEGETDTSYVTIRVTLFGFIRAKDCQANIVDNGMTVRILVSLRAEDTDPWALLVLNEDCPSFNESHAQYSSLSKANRCLSDATIDGSGTTDTFQLFAHLPFECEREFVDPFSSDDSKLSVGDFPLDPKLHKQIPNAPPPSVKFLHISCEEKNKKKGTQTFKGRGFFTRTRS